MREDSGRVLSAPEARERPDDLLLARIENGHDVERAQRDQQVSRGEGGRAARERPVEDLDGVGVEDVAFALHRREGRRVVGPFEGLEHRDLLHGLAVRLEDRDEIFGDQVVGVDVGQDLHLVGHDVDRAVPGDREIVVRLVGGGPEEARLPVDAGEPDVLPDDEEVAARQELRAAPVLVVAGLVLTGLAIGPDGVDVEGPAVTQGPGHVDQQRLRAVRGNREVPAAKRAVLVVESHAPLIRGGVVPLEVRELRQGPDLLARAPAATRRPAAARTGAAGAPGRVFWYADRSNRYGNRRHLCAANPYAMAPARAASRARPARAFFTGTGVPAFPTGRPRGSGSGPLPLRLQLQRRQPFLEPCELAVEQPPRGPVLRDVVVGADARGSARRCGGACRGRRRRRARRRSRPRARRRGAGRRARESAAAIAKRSAPTSTARKSRAWRFSSFGPSLSIWWKRVRASLRVVRSAKRTCPASAPNSREPRPASPAEPAATGTTSRRSPPSSAAPPAFVPIDAFGSAKAPATARCGRPPRAR